VIARCGVAAERVVTVPNGVSPAFCPAPAAEVHDFRRRKGLPGRFILFVGTLEPRKNIERLVEAYAHLRRRDPAAPPLVIAGGKGWFYETIFRRVHELGVNDAISFPGFIASDELPSWYRAATIFIYPSRFEGFGLPVLEAMACGTPVITSTESSLPEVAGDATLLVGPDDVPAMADAMARLLGEPELAAELSARGLRQAAQFSWARTARETAQVYLEALGHYQEQAQ
jgi:glycosyltransferase involved in cell wall biosynthesis